MTGIIWVAGALAALYITVLILLYVFQERMIFLPSSVIAVTPADAGLSFEDVYFESENGKTLHGWIHFTDRDAPVILFCHGNAGNISGRISMMQFFAELGYNTFLFDYQGYGKSEGRPGEKELLADGLAAWDVLEQRFDIPPEKILPVGRSLGSSVAAWIAANRPARALVLESAFTSVPDVAAGVYPILPVRRLARVELNTLEYLKSFDGPVLIGHSQQDEVIPYHLGRKLYEKAPGEKTWMEMQGRHNDGFALTGELYKETYRTFIARWFENEVAE